MKLLEYGSVEVSGKVDRVTSYSTRKIPDQHNCVSNEYRMADNETISCEEDKDCLFVAGNEFFRVWHVILIAAAIIILICK